MALFVERAGADLLTGQELVEQLGLWLAGQYQAVETMLLERIAAAVAQDLDAGLLTTRLDVIRRLRAETAAAFAQLADEQLARRVLDTAMREGEAAAIEQLGFTRAAAGGVTIPTLPNGAPLPLGTGITQGSALAAAQIGFDLQNALDDMAARTVRMIPDVYQRTIAAATSEKILAGGTLRQAQNKAVGEFLSGSVLGFRDVAGRNWRIGTYAEMATRTATNRAWLEAHMNRWQGMGLNLVTIVRGADSCQRCAAWSGKVLSMDGSVSGTITAEHATTGEPVEVTVVGSVAEARAGGWNHPNCRCTLTPVFPGLSLPADDTTYDPQAERNRDRMRYLERRVREAKRQAQIAGAMGDDVGAAAARRLARQRQEQIRLWSAQTGQVRKPYRESLNWSDGRRGPTPSAPRPVLPPKPPVDPVRDTLDRLQREAAERAALTQPLRESLAGMTTRADMVRAAQARYPRVEFLGFDATGLNVDSVRSVLSAVGDMLDKYPPGASFRFVEAASIKSRGTLAHVGYRFRMGTQGMTVNTARLRQSPAEFERQLKASVDSGHFHHFDDMWASTITHEYGHVIDNALHVAGGEGFNSKGPIGFPLRPMVKETVAELRELAAIPYGDAYNTWLRAQVSGYGRTSSAESVAELFADAELNGSNATEVARLFHQRMIEKYREAGIA